VPGGGTRRYLRLYTGFENLLTELPDNFDVVFIGAFTEAAHTAYALSNLFRSRGAITVIGGPHARCYPEDSARYFDYVLGFTDQGTLRDVLRDCSQHRPRASTWRPPSNPEPSRASASAGNSSTRRCGKRPSSRWFPCSAAWGARTLALSVSTPRAISSHGLRGAPRGPPVPADKFKRPLVAWHDPNFGVRFNDYMDMIEDAVPPGSIDFVAESSLSLLSEAHLKRLNAIHSKASFLH